MKRLLFSAFFLGLVATSCSSDDNNNADTDSPNIYLPLTDGNFWNYNVVASDQTQMDNLFVSGDQVINGVTYKKMMTSATPFGFYSSSMNNNAVRKSGSSLLMTGTASLNFPGVTTPISLNLTDFVIFRENAADNDALSSASGQTVQDMQGLPVTLQYTLRSTAGETLATYTVDGTTYNDVKVVDVAMNLTAFSSMDISGVPVNVPILNSQDVLVSHQYYAKNIGMIYASSTFSYQLQDLSTFGITLPIPQSMTQISTESLDSYEIN